MPAPTKQISAQAASLVADGATLATGGFVVPEQLLVALDRGLAHGGLALDSQLLRETAAGRPGPMTRLADDRRTMDPGSFDETHDARLVP